MAVGAETEEIVFSVGPVMRSTQGTYMCPFRVTTPVDSEAGSAELAGIVVERLHMLYYRTRSHDSLCRRSATFVSHGVNWDVGLR